MTGWKLARDVLIGMLIAVAAIMLFGVGIAQLWRNQSEAGTSALGFAFLLVTLLLLSKFKTLKGFGFHAETWDQKQVEAAKLVDQLTLLTEVFTEQAALQASRVGLWGSALSEIELDSLARNIEKVLGTIAISRSRCDDILKPIHDRMERIPIINGIQLVQETLNLGEKIASDVHQRNLTETGDQSALQSLVDAQKAAHDWRSQHHNDLLNSTTLHQLIAYVKSEATLRENSSLLKHLHDLQRGLEHFQKHKNLLLHQAIENEI